MQFTYPNGSCVTDNLPSYVIYDTDFIQFAKTLAQKSTSRVEIEFAVDQCNVKQFAVNGKDYIAYSGHNYAYCVKLLIDELGKQGYFA